MRKPAVRSPGSGPCRFRDLWAVILAAGGAHRFGRNKLLLQMGGESLARRAVRQATRVTGCRCLVVLGADAGQLRAEVCGLGATVVLNRRWRDGMAASLQAGLAALPSSAGAALVLLADQYALTADDLEKLARAWSRAPRSPVAADIAGQPGAPAVLPRRQFAAIRSLRGDQGARRLLRAAGATVQRIDLPAALHDLDAAGDLEHFHHFRRRTRP